MIRAKTPQDTASQKFARNVPVHGLDPRAIAFLAKIIPITKTMLENRGNSKWSGTISPNKGGTPLTQRSLPARASKTLTLFANQHGRIIPNEILAQKVLRKQKAGERFCFAMVPARVTLRRESYDSSPFFTATLLPL